MTSPTEKLRAANAYMDANYEPLRCNATRVSRKPLKQWLRELRASWGNHYYQWKNGDTGDRLPFSWPSFYVYEFTPMIHAGEPGYDEARYEVGFIVSSQSFERKVSQ